MAQRFALECQSRVRSLGFIKTAFVGRHSRIVRATRAEQAGSVLPLILETITRCFSPETIAANVGICGMRV